jgi:acetyl esterase/lipase
MTSVSTPYPGFEYQEFYRRRQQHSSWLILGYEEVQHVLSDPLTFSSQRERGGPHIKYQVLLYPVTDATLETLSYREGGGYWLTCETMRATLEQLRGLPPAFIITREQDVVRDEGEAYAHQFMAAGVPVRATRYLWERSTISYYSTQLRRPLLREQPSPRSLIPCARSFRAQFCQKEIHKAAI